MNLDLRESFKIDIKKTVDDITEFIKKNIENAGCKTAIIGLSGGIDSAVSAALAVKALGSDNVITVFMPYVTSNPQSSIDSHTVSNWLNTKNFDIDITPMVDSYFSSFPEADPLRRGNFMARQRMCILYDHSALYKGLVIGTCNKTEELLGYSTLFGDSACAMNPIGDLYKTQVWEMARYLGIPQQVIDKAPSGDLWQGQTDEGEMGFTYFDADRILYLMFDKELNDGEIIKIGFDEDIVSKIRKMCKRNAFKRAMPPIFKLNQTE